MAVLADNADWINWLCLLCCRYLLDSCAGSLTWLSWLDMLATPDDFAV
jgi:hypothetical protein